MYAPNFKCQHKGILFFFQLRLCSRHHLRNDDCLEDKRFAFCMFLPVCSCVVCLCCVYSLVSSALQGLAVEEFSEMTNFV